MVILSTFLFAHPRFEYTDVVRRRTSSDVFGRFRVVQTAGQVHLEQNLIPKQILKYVWALLLKKQIKIAKN